jgi:hypothetical protein
MKGVSVSILEKTWLSQGIIRKAQVVKNIDYHLRNIWAREFQLMNSPKEPSFLCLLPS